MQSRELSNEISVGREKVYKKLRARAHARTSDGSRQRVKHLLRGSLGRVLAPFYLAIIPLHGPTRAVR